MNNSYTILKNKTNKLKTATSKEKGVAPKQGQKVVATNKNTNTERNVFISGLIGVVTSVKNMQLNYTENSGTVKTDGNGAWSGDSLSVTSISNPTVVEAFTYNNGVTVYLRYLGSFS
jgi:hypothetical protein